MTATATGPAQLLVVLANIDQSRKRGWQSKARIVSVIGASEDGALGVATIARAAGGLSTATVHRLLAELVEDRVLVQVEEGAGRRSARWAVVGDVERWRRVPWLVDPRAMAWEVFHVAPPRDANAGLRRDPWNRDTSRRSVATPYIATQPDPASRSHGSRHNESARVAVPCIATQPEPGPEKGFPSSGSDSEASSSSGDREAEAGIDPAEWEKLRRLVMTAGGGAYLRGRAADELAAVVRAHGVEQVRAWVMEAPKRLGVPMLVDWLATRAYEPSADELAALAARPDDEPDQPAEPAPIDQATRPVLRPVAEVLAADEPPAPAESVRAALREARGLLDPLGDHPTGRLNPTEVTQ